MPNLGINIPKLGIEPKSPPRTASAVIEPADALFSTTQQRVLGLLFGQPQRSFRATELIELTQSGSGAVQRELRKLVAGGFVTVTPYGNSKLIQANRAAPLFDELLGFVLKTFGLADPLRTALQPLAAHMSLALIYGYTDIRSDAAVNEVGLLIVADETLPLEGLYAALDPVGQRLGRKISLNIFTLSTFQRRVKAGHPSVARILGDQHITLLGEDYEHHAKRTLPPDPVPAPQR